METLPIIPHTQHFIAEELDSSQQEMNDIGFIVFSSGKSHPMKAKVISISDEFDNSGLDLKIGDIVILPKYGSTCIKYGETQKRYQLCHRLDIIGILRQ